MEIQIIDPIYSKVVGKKDISKILSCFKYKKTFWVQGKYAREKRVKEAYFIHRGTGQFLTGFLPGISLYCRAKDIPLKILSDSSSYNKPRRPELPNIKLREDQQELVQAVAKAHRGVILSPTRSGKTIVALAVMSMYPTAKILFLSHTLAIIYQTLENLKKFRFKNVSLMGGGNKCLPKKGIVVSTIQTFHKLNPADYCDLFDIVMIDECHHLASRTGMYAKVLERSLSPIRIGFTATLPPLGSEARLTVEGYLGPVIGEVTMQRAVKEKIVARVIIKLLPVQYNSTIGDLKKWKDIYREGVVRSRSRNHSGLKEAYSRVKRNKSVLILVKEIVHGEILQGMGHDVFGMDIEFVQGKTEAEVRESVKVALKSKEVSCVIATAVWREGVDIPSLDCVINACGGKSEIMTLQGISRGLTKTEDKEEVEIIDFLDPYTYLARHTIMRLKIYVENKWL